MKVQLLMQILKEHLKRFSTSSETRVYNQKTLQAQLSLCITSASKNNERRRGQNFWKQTIADNNAVRANDGDYYMLDCCLKNDSLWLPDIQYSHLKMQHTSPYRICRVKNVTQQIKRGTYVCLGQNITSNESLVSSCRRRTPINTALCANSSRTHNHL